MATIAPDPKPNRTWLYVGLGFVVAWGLILVLFAPSLVTEESPIDRSGPAKMADYSWSMMNLEDQPVAFSGFKGKTVFLNIWATWCGPCVSEMPSIATLAADPRLKDDAFLCVSTEDSSEPIKRFLEGKNWPMTMLRAVGGPAVFHTDGIPATFIIGPDGAIASTTVGSAEWDNPKTVAFLLELESKKSAGKDEPKAE